MKKNILPVLLMSILILGFAQIGKSQVKKSEKYTKAKLDSISAQIKLRYRKSKETIGTNTPSPQNNSYPDGFIRQDSGLPLTKANESERLKNLEARNRTKEKDTNMVNPTIKNTRWEPLDADAHKEADVSNAKSVSKHNSKMVTKAAEQSSKALLNRRWNKN